MAAQILFTLRLVLRCYPSPLSGPDHLNCNATLHPFLGLILDTRNVESRDWLPALVEIAEASLLTVP